MVAAHWRLIFEPDVLIPLGVGFLMLLVSFPAMFEDFSDFFDQWKSLLDAKMHPSFDGDDLFDGDDTGSSFLAWKLIIWGGLGIASTILTYGTMSLGM